MISEQKPPMELEEHWMFGLWPRRLWTSEDSGSRRNTWIIRK